MRDLLVLAALVVLAGPTLGQEPTVLWRRHVEAVARPVLEDGVLYVETDAATPIAIDLASGEVLWRGEDRGAWGNWNRGDTPLSVHGDRLYRVGDDHRGYVVDLATGRTLRRIESPPFTHRTAPLEAGGLVLSLVQHDLRVLLRARDRDTFDLRWELEILAPAVRPGLAADDRRVYVAAGNGSIRAIDLETGRVAWSRLYPSIEGGELGAVMPRCLGEWLVVRSADDDSIRFLERETGREVARSTFHEGRSLIVGPEALHVIPDPDLVPVDDLRPCGDGVMDGKTIVLPLDDPPRSGEVVLHWIDLAANRSIARLPVAGRGDVHLHGGVLVLVGYSEVVAVRHEAASEWWARRDAYLRHLAEARRTGDPDAFDRALRLAASRWHRIEVSIERADALVRAGRTRDAIFAYLDLLADHGTLHHLRQGGRSVDIGAHARTRLEILFDLAGRDAEHVEAYFERFRAAGADRRRLRGLPADLVPPDLRDLIR